MKSESEERECPQNIPEGSSLPPVSRGIKVSDQRGIFRFAKFCYYYLKIRIELVVHGVVLLLRTASQGLIYPCSLFKDRDRVSSYAK